MHRRIRSDIIVFCILLMSIGVFHIVMAPQRCRRRRCANSATRKTLLLCWIAASFSNTNRALVAVGFGFTTPSTTTTQYSRMQMGYDDVYDENDDVSSKEGDFQKKQPRKPRARMKKSVSSAHSSLLPPPAIGKGSNRRRWANIDSQSSSSCDNEGGNDPTVPKIQSAQSDLNEAANGNAVDESRRQGRRRQQSKSKSPSHPTTQITRDESSPEWGDLFSSPLSSSQHDEYSDVPSITPTTFPTPVIEGVLPVSELFYRSTQSISSVEGEDDEDERDNDVASRDARAWKRTRAKSYKNAETDGETGDDEELPFSAEQSDRLSIPGNKIQIRRNKAEGSSQLLDEIATGIGIGLDGNKIPSEAVRRELKSMARQEQAEQRQLDRRLKQQQNRGQPQENDDNQRNVESEKSVDMASKSAKGIKKKLKAPKADRSSGRKMVRRGMEMLVGGEPINADPPQRAIELNYFNRHPRLWNRAITLNSPDFGPFLHMHAAGKISKKEVGLYAENFVHNAIKWNVCPDDLKDMVSENELRIRNDNAAVEHASALDTNEVEETAEDVKSAIQSSLALEGLESDLNEGIIHDDKGGTIMFNPRELEPPKGFGAASKKSKRKRESRGGASGITSKEPNIRPYNRAGDISKDLGLKDLSGDSKLMFTLGGELKFS